MRPLVPMLLALSLGGCAVTSETPLFGPADRAAHPLAQGVWAIHGPGCDVAPGQKPPECAATLAVRGNRLEPDGSSMTDAMGMMGPAADGAHGMSGPNEFLLAEGDPEILQLRDLGKTGANAGGPGAPPPTPGQRSYMAFRPLHQNEAGATDRGVLWMVLCPKSVASTPGFKSSGPGCEATTRKAVLEQAKHLPPLFSFFMTWIGPAPTRPAD